MRGGACERVSQLTAICGDAVGLGLAEGEGGLEGLAEGEGGLKGLAEGGGGLEGLAEGGGGLGTASCSAPRRGAVGGALGVARGGGSLVGDVALPPLLATL